MSVRAKSSSGSRNGQSSGRPDSRGSSSVRPNTRGSSVINSQQQQQQQQSQQQQRKVVGQYMLGKTIGEGTFGKVKLAIHLPTGEKVKNMLPCLSLTHRQTTLSFLFSPLYLSNKINIFLPLPLITKCVFLARLFYKRLR